MTPVSDSEVLFVFVTTNGKGTAIGKIGVAVHAKGNILHKNL